MGVNSMKGQSKMRIRSILNILIIITLTVGFALSVTPKAQAGIPMPLVVTNLSDSGPGSLRFTIDNAADGDTIVFQDGLTGKIPLTRELYIQKSITIAGPGPYKITISGEAKTNVIRIAKDQTVTISGVSVKNGAASKYPGGGISNEGTLTIANMLIDSNTADTFGGGVYNSELATMTIFQCTVSNNEAKGYAGAAGGGGIWNDGHMKITYAYVNYNTAPVAGGGIYNDTTGYLEINFAQIIGNYIYGLGQGYAWGGGIFNQADYVSEPDVVGWISIMNTTIANNEGTGFFTSGGGVSNIGSMSIQATKILNNSVSGVGGGVDNEGAMEIIQTTIDNNLAYGDFGDGGGIENSGSLTLLDTTISNNTGHGVGGGLDKWLGEMWMWNSTISGNIAYKSGGGLYNFGHPSEVINSTITNNTADGDMDGYGNGGGLFNENQIDPTPKTGAVESSIQSVNWLPTYVTFQNTILAGNIDKGGEANDCFIKPGGTLTSEGNNLIQDLNGCTIDGPATDDIYGIDAQLYPLANNGGPTLTHHPKVGSPAVDAANDTACPPTDQRGATRPHDGNNDGTAICDIGSVEGILGPDGNNWAPFANPQTVYTFEDNPIDITLTGADPEGDAITFAVKTNPAHGTLSGTAPNLTYSPAQDWYGTDSFTFSVTDTHGGSSVATITINVLPVNDAPIVDAGPPKEALEGYPVTLNGSYTDVDEDAPPYILWDLGDGTQVEGSLTPTHTYPGPGVYYATLYVVDSYGAVGYDYTVVTIHARAELSITKVASDNPALAGSPLVYTLTVSNAGPSAATSVVVEDVLPYELEFVSASEGCQLIEETGLLASSPQLVGDKKVVCSIDSIPAGNQVEIEIVTKIPVDFSGILVNTASVSANEADTDSTDNEVPVTTKVEPTLTLYCNDFETSVGSEWTNTKMSTTPSGRNFLGDFGNQKVSLKLANLPTHKRVYVTYDLFLIRSWDGNRVYWESDLQNASPDALVVGPDHWVLGIDNQSLIDTTFSNWDSLGFRQAYPGIYPYGDFPARLGSVEKNTLGYTFSGNPMDGVYSMTVIAEHTANTFQLDFSAYNIQELIDESWGVDNVCVHVAYDANLLGNTMYIPLVITP
jgi:uncharacterized repeat protein (TIGR01451 family)